MNLALIGYGYWGKIWEKVLRNQDKFNLRNIYTPNLKNRGIYTNNIDNILSNAIDAVIVCTPIHTHYKITKQFLESGKHVLCEKPMTINSKKAEELAELAKSKNLVLETNYSYLNSPTIKLMKKYLLKIGKVYAMESFIDSFGNFYKGEDVYSVHCPHIVAVTLFFFPDFQFTVETKNIVFSKENTVDVGLIILKSSDFVSLIHSSLRGIKKERKIVVFGEKGVIEYDATSNKQFKFKEYEEKDYKLLEGEYVSKAFDESKNLNRAILNFYNIIKGKEKNNIELSLRVSKLLEQISHSIKR